MKSRNINKSKKVLIRLKAITKGKHWAKWFDYTYYHCNITNYEEYNKYGKTSICLQHK
jgi:hypothetical protein